MPQPECWHAGVHPSSTDRPAFFAPSLAGWSSTSTPGGGQEFWCVCTASMHPNIPQLLACWHAGMLVDGQPAREGGKNAGLSVLLGCTPACQHPQLLACWHAGMLVDGQPAREGAKNAVCAVGMHPSMPAPPVVGMLACWDANQQHRQTSMTTTEALAEVAWPWLWMLVCTPAPSTQHPAILGYTRGCWPCGHASYLTQRNLQPSLSCG